MRDLDEHETLFVWRIENGLTQEAVAEMFDLSQNAISKMEIGWDDRQGLPVRDDIKSFLDKQTIHVSLSSEVAVLRRRSGMLKAEAAGELDISTYIIGEMENPKHERDPTEEYYNLVAQ